MATDPEKDGEHFDIALLGSRTQDGGGRQVMRIRPDGASLGEIRPLQEGHPIYGEVIQLKPRQEAPWIYDVSVAVPSKSPPLNKTPPPETFPARHGPAQVATPTYRENWERIFGGKKSLKGVNLPMQPSPGWIPPPPGARRAPSRSSIRWPLVLGGALGGLLLIALLSHRILFRWVIEHQASSLGLSLRFQDLSVGLGTVSVTEARFGLLGQKLLVGEADTLEFEPSLLRASRVIVKKGRIVVVGSLRTVLEGVSQWRSAHGKSSGIEVACRDTSLELRDEATSPPWLQVSGANATPSGRGGRVRTGGVSLFGVEVGPVSFGWMSRSQGLSLWLGEGGESASHSRLELLSTQVPTVRITLQGAPLASLAQPLGFPSTGSAVLDGQAELAFPAGQGLVGKMSGVVRGVKVTGAEWSGLVLGPVTLSARILGTQDGNRVVLEGLTAQSGGMTLQGAVDWTQQLIGGILRGQLAGTVPCGMLLGKAVSAGVGGALGNLAGTVASAAVGGQVSISVAFQVDTRAPRTGTVTPQIGVGCNLLGF